MLVRRMQAPISPYVSPMSRLCLAYISPMLVRRVQAGGVDWSIIRFVGTERAFEVVEEGRRQEARREEERADDAPPLEPDH